MAPLRVPSAPSPRPPRTLGSTTKPQNPRNDYRPLAQKRARIPTPRARNTDLLRKKRSLIPTPDASFGPFLPPGSAQGAYVGEQNGGRDGRDRRVPTKPHDTDPSRKVSWPEAAKRRTFCWADDRNTDPWHNEYRPRRQRIPTRGAREYRPVAQGNTDLSRKNGREYRLLAQGIPTPRTSLV
jgi:hypothetical protein